MEAKNSIGVRIIEDVPSLRFDRSPECPPVSTSHLILNSADGKKEVGRYSKDGARLFSPLYMNDIVFTTSTNNESSHLPYQTPLSLMAIDVSNPAKPKLIWDIPLTFNGVSAASGG